MRYREPYNARHSSVTWNLMVGKNMLWVADQHGHSPDVMLTIYATWLRGATEEDIEQIRQAMADEPTDVRVNAPPPRASRGPANGDPMATQRAVEPTQLAQTAYPLTTEWSSGFDATPSPSL